MGRTGALNKRAAILGLLSGVGILRLWRNTGSDRLLVVNYHRVMDWADDNPFDDEVVTCAPAVFDAQIAMLQKYRTIISMHDFVAWLKEGGSLPARPTLITFDDGYVDNFENAFQILRKRGAPACFFLPVRRVETRELEWWDHIACAIKRAEPGIKSIEIDGRIIDLQLDCAAHRRRSTAMLLRIVKETGAAIEPLYEELNSERPSRLAESSQIMTDEQIREILAEPGFAIGGHSVSHTVLSTLNYEEQSFEIRESRWFLERRFGVPVRTFAYPVGEAGHYNNVSRQLVEEAGYACAFNFRREARDVPLRRIKRYDIDRIHPTRVLDPIFEARASGFFIV
jgi:peptidoglycan/xylan/chitin deacetylase (PgdA/CDA1 family)